MDHSPNSLLSTSKLNQRQLASGVFPSLFHWWRRWKKKVPGRTWSYSQLQFHCQVESVSNVPTWYTSWYTWDWGHPHDSLKKTNISQSKPLRMVWKTGKNIMIAGGCSKCYSLGFWTWSGLWTTNYTLNITQFVLRCSIRYLHHEYLHQCSKTIVKLMTVPGSWISATSLDHSDQISPFIRVPVAAQGLWEVWRKRPNLTKHGTFSNGSIYHLHKNTGHWLSKQSPTPKQYHRNKSDSLAWFHHRAMPTSESNMFSSSKTTNARRTGKEHQPLTAGWPHRSRPSPWCPRPASEGCLDLNYFASAEEKGLLVGFDSPFKMEH